MKALSRTELERSLREGVRPLYLLLGTETFLAESQRRKLLKRR
jgi:DNA polymerase III delta subunit